MAAVLIGLATAAASAQTPTRPPTPPPGPPSGPPVGPPNNPSRPLGSTLTVDAIGMLPSNGSLYSLLDSAIPEVVGDLVDSGGLTTGAAGRLGAHGSTWTQTTYRLGSADITSPIGGAPLLVPGTSAWERVEVATGALPITVNSPGLAILMTPRRPSAMWTRTLEIGGAPAFLRAGSAEMNPPPIVRLNTWLSGDLLLSGPIIPNRLGLTLTSTWTRSSRFDRGATGPVDSSLGSLFTNFVYTPTSNDEVRAVVWGQQTTSPRENRLVFGEPQATARNSGAHGQVEWSRNMSGGMTLSSFFGYTGRNHLPDGIVSRTATVERLRDGPVPQIIYPGEGSDRSWSYGASLRPSASRLGGVFHSWRVGVEGGGATARSQPTFSGRVGETIDGLPARIWDFGGAGISRWQSTSIAAYASDSIQLLPHVTLDAGVRFEAITGTAEGGTTGISWRNFLPRAGVRWAVTEGGTIASYINYGRYGYRLPLGVLAYGDVSAPVANVFRWTGGSVTDPTSPGPVVSRVGPGTGGDPTFSAIDPGLKRPFMDELTVGIELRPASTARLRIAALGRHEQQLIGVLDVGAPVSAYSVITIPDPGVDLVSSSDDQLLPVYNRLPSTFGKNRYLLTNPTNDPATFIGAEATFDFRVRRVFMQGGFSAGRSYGLSANRGFLATENDQGLLGELFTNPNAGTYAKGRLFTERGYTAKLVTMYRSEKDLSLGVTSRYQDGQHFARLVIVQDLNQGTEAVRAFPNGKTRFTFTATLDARLEKGFPIGGHRVGAFIEGYNLLNWAKEIEEFPVTGSSPRLTAAVQPPRAMHVGLRVDF